VRIELRPLVDELLDECAPRLELTQVAASSSVPAGAAIQGERFLLRQALQNLIDNAIAFTPEGGALEVGVTAMPLPDGRPALALEAVCNGAESLDEELRRHSDIEPARLDPVEHAILQLGLWELMSQSDIPYKVVINEAVGLARRFGATDGHRYVNAVLDKASRGHRAIERGAVA
jgi:hypothetical protein